MIPEIGFEGSFKDSIFKVSGMNFVKIAILMVITMLFASCGIKAPPKPSMSGSKEVILCSRAQL